MHPFGKLKSASVPTGGNEEEVYSVLMDHWQKWELLEHFWYAVGQYFASTPCKNILSVCSQTNPGDVSQGLLVLCSGSAATPHFYQSKRQSSYVHGMTLISLTHLLVPWACWLLLHSQGPPAWSPQQSFLRALLFLSPKAFLPRYTVYTDISLSLQYIQTYSQPP